MTNKIEMANDVVIESGYKQIETVQLLTAAVADNSIPSAASDGAALSGSYGGIIQVAPGAGDSADVRVWGYCNGSATWSRISELDKTAVDADGLMWKATIAGVDRIYVQLVSGVYVTGIDVWFHRSYS